MLHAIGHANSKELLTRISCCCNPACKILFIKHTVDLENVLRKRGKLRDAS
jgi:hypothetical protein